MVQRLSVALQRGFRILLRSAETSRLRFSASHENFLIEQRGARKDRIDPGLVPVIGEERKTAGHPTDRLPRDVPAEKEKNYLRE